MYKKAQGISITVIVIAAIALLVLVVLSIIFMGGIGSFGKGLQECSNKGGKCSAVGESCGQMGSSVEAYPTTYDTWKCLDADGKTNPNKHCCVAIS